MVIVISVHCQPNLPQLILILNPLSCFAGGLDGGQEQCHNNRTVGVFNSVDLKIDGRFVNGGPEFVEVASGDSLHILTRCHLDRTVSADLGFHLLQAGLQSEIQRPGQRRSGILGGGFVRRVHRQRKIHSPGDIEP